MPPLVVHIVADVQKSMYFSSTINLSSSGEYIAVSDGWALRAAESWQ